MKVKIEKPINKLTFFELLKLLTKSEEELIAFGIAKFNELNPRGKRSAKIYINELFLFPILIQVSVKKNGRTKLIYTWCRFRRSVWVTPQKFFFQKRPFHGAPRKRKFSKIASFFSSLLKRWFGREKLSKKIIKKRKLFWKLRKQTLKSKTRHRRRLKLKQCGLYAVRRARFLRDEIIGGNMYCIIRDLDWSDTLVYRIRILLRLLKHFVAFIIDNLTLHKLCFFNWPFDNSVKILVLVPLFYHYALKWFGYLGTLPLETCMPAVSLCVLIFDLIRVRIRTQEKRFPLPKIFEEYNPPVKARFPLWMDAALHVAAIRRFHRQRRFFIIIIILTIAVIWIK